MSLTRRSLIKGTGAAGAAVAAGAMAPKVFRSSMASAQDTVQLSVWKAPHTPDDQKFFDEKLAAYVEANPGVEVEYRVTPWETWQETYTAAFAGREDVALQKISPHVAHSHHLFPVLVNVDALRVGRDDVMRQMLARGVGVSLHYRPLHLFADFSRRCRIGLQCGRNSEWIHKRLISLPLHTRMSDGDVDRVAATLIEILEANRR